MLTHTAPPRFSNAEVASSQSHDILPNDSTAGPRSSWTELQPCPACSTSHQLTTRKIIASDLPPQQLLSYIATDPDGAEEEVPISIFPGIAASTVAPIRWRSRTGFPDPDSQGRRCTLVALARDIEGAVRSLGFSQKPTISNTISLTFADTKDNRWVFYPENFPLTRGDPPCEAHGGHTVSRLRGSLASADAPNVIKDQGMLSYDHILTRHGHVSTLKTFFSDECPEMSFEGFDEWKAPCIWTGERQHAAAVMKAGEGLAVRVKNQDQDY